MERRGFIGGLIALVSGLFCGKDSEAAGAPESTSAQQFDNKRNLEEYLPGIAGLMGACRHRHYIQMLNCTAAGGDIDDPATVVIVDRDTARIHRNETGWRAVWDIAVNETRPHELWVLVSDVSGEFMRSVHFRVQWTDWNDYPRHSALKRAFEMTLKQCEQAEPSLILDGPRSPVCIVHGETVIGGATECPS